jgi:hypothetical protein
MRPFSHSNFQSITIESDASEDALAAAARQAVTASFKAECRLDPLLPPEISKLMSACTSAVIRHGPLIEQAIAEALERNGLTVLRNIHVPVTGGAMAMVGSDKYSQIAADQLPFNEKDIAGYVDADIIAIDEKNRCAGAFSVKRGGGAAGTKKRTSDDRDLRAMGFILASWLRQQGYRLVDSALAMVIDYYGQAGFPRDLSINRTELDDFFELPIVAEVDRMNEAMRTAIDVEIRRVLESIPRMTLPPIEKIRKSPKPAIGERPNPPRRTRPNWGGNVAPPIEIKPSGRTSGAGARSN